MALEDRTSLLFGNPIGRRRSPNVPGTPPAPVGGQRSAGFGADALAGRTSLLRPNFSTISGVSGNMSANGVAISNQASPAQTLPLELIPTGYFNGDYFESGYYEQ